MTHCWHPVRDGRREVARVCCRCGFVQERVESRRPPDGHGPYTPPAEQVIREFWAGDSGDCAGEAGRREAA